AAKQAEEGLRQSEERLRALVNASSDVVYRMSPDWSEMRQLDGRGFIADTSAPIRDWIPAYIHPDDQVLVTRTIQNAIRNKGVFELEHRVRQTDGGLGWTLSRAVPRLDANGEIIEWIGMASNVTPRKLAEEAIRESRARLAAALASMTDAVFISDAQGRFIEFNDAFATFHRFKSKADCAQTLAEYPSFLDVFMPNGDLAPLDMWAVPRALRGETVTDAEYTLRRKDTGETWVGNYSFAPIRDKDRVIVGSVVVGRDITQKKANEREIRQLNEELERRVHERTAELEAANKELEAFTYSVSHDLRAPLRHISGFSQILTEEFAASLPPEAQRHLQRIEEGTRHMGQLVDDLLNLARIGRRDLTLQVTGLKSVVEEVIRSLKSDIGDRQVEWRIGNLPYVDCDTALMTQVFQNLLSNALKFTRPRAQAVIDVGLEEKDGTSLVYVRDNGVGFSMKYADKLFGVFQRLHRQEDFEGTGVGLATVQRIIQKHGGRIWADAELDKGATFYFTLGTSEITGNKAKSAVAGDQV
ncbi:MAG TPA: ATP-binding protein, partial [Terriglobales bacterium]|nr:ATP-binding protein [Terriglobales bacterium]